MQSNLASLAIYLICLAIYFIKWLLYKTKIKIIQYKELAEMILCSTLIEIEIETNWCLNEIEIEIEIDALLKLKPKSKLKSKLNSKLNNNNNNNNNNN